MKVFNKVTGQYENEEVSLYLMAGGRITRYDGPNRMTIGIIKSEKELVADVINQQELTNEWYQAQAEQATQEELEQEEVSVLEISPSIEANEDTE